MSKGIFEHKFLQVNCPNGNTKDEYTKIMNGRAKYRDKNIFLNNVEPFPPPKKLHVRKNIDCQIYWINYPIAILPVFLF